MKTKLLVLTAVIVTAMSAPTMAADWFIGGGVGAQQNNYKSSSTKSSDTLKVAPITTNTSEKENNEFYEVRGGAYLNDNNRIYSTYSYNSDDFTKQQSLLLSYDYLIGLGVNNKLNWFIGATAGVNHVSPDTQDLSSKNSFIWGGQTGFMYKISDKLSTELGYRYLTQNTDFTSKFSDEKYTTTFTDSLDNSQQVYLAVDYRF
ncbi:outer membrane beta-barrel protein [Shewanella violacea]|uniref:Outer membrane protein beta-barrel domain-containing protein n=1 Tax=Shewanella violacea (strain JCM 10179 / CIP 106290 / LMG 19151 / DSS12) TaxID=637905 RepID=D4ZD34_SHEVD|nr:outer membrane beta-barrel protein [Shewanella violacea]BAJ03929.1 conserved hypothetical protein [Shewanella violacea DSS12]